jgi:hypothetical protein
MSAGRSGPLTVLVLRTGEGLELARDVVMSLELLIAEAEIGPAGVIRRARIELDIAAITTGNDRRESDLANPRFWTRSDTQRCTSTSNRSPCATVVGRQWLLC